MKKNLMFIIPTLCGGGAEKTVANLSNYFIEDFNIDIVTFKETEMKYSYSGNLTILSKKKNSNVIKKVIFTIRSIFQLRKLKKEKKIDYAISFVTPADALNVFSKVKGCKTIISIRNTDSILMKNKLLKFVTLISCKKCDHIVSISRQVKDDLINNFGISKNKITTIYNPALKIEFGKSPMDNSLFQSDFIAMNIGRLVEQKGQWHLIRAFSEVVKVNSNAKLLILGEGPLRNYLQELIEHYQMKENVILVGFVNNPYDYLKKSDCFVFSSLYEGLGNSLLEALTCEMPIISSDCISGPREILAPHTNYKEKVKDRIDWAEYGVLVPTCNGKMMNYQEPLTKQELLLSQAILELMEHREKLKHYKNCSIKRREDFKIENIKMEWIDLLKNI